MAGAREPAPAPRERPVAGIGPGRETGDANAGLVGTSDIERGEDVLATPASERGDRSDGAHREAIPADEL